MYKIINSRRKLHRDRPAGGPVFRNREWLVPTGRASLQENMIMTQVLPLAFISMPGGIEWVIIGLVALLLFGRRLPGVARSLGEALNEFKSGLAGKGGKDDKEEKEGNADGGKKEE